ncbi:MAG: hypothetical protein KAT14_00765 [Candidatus Marinimicrobia bacterium]|nr:hypothetical protein [Candidatus Neomarinimicrobiota bacterium]
MKFFKVLSIILIVCVVIFIAVGIFLPKTSTLERNYVLNAPPLLIQNEILELYNNHLWPIWNTEDTSIVFTPLENGGGYRWEGKQVAYGECRYSLGVDFTIYDYISFRGEEMAETVWRLEGADPVKLHFELTIFAGQSLGARWTNLFIDRMIGIEIDRMIADIKDDLESDGLKPDTP